jgi:hypothetical protein
MHRSAAPLDYLLQCPQICSGSQGGEDDTAEEKTAEYIRKECWEKLSVGGGWPTVGWREAFVCSLIILALQLMEKAGTMANDERANAFAKAMQHLDLALIMGGPAAYELVHQIVDMIEPRFQAQASPTLTTTDEPLDPEDYIVSDHSPASAPTMVDSRAIRKAASISFDQFKKEFFKTDTPVVSLRK